MLQKQLEERNGYANTEKQKQKPQNKQHQQKMENKRETDVPQTDP